MLNTMKNLIIIFMLIMLISCDNNGSSDYMDTGIGVSIKDQQNNDLLNPETLNTYNTDSIAIFYLINGGEIEHEEYFESRDIYLDNPKGYSIYQENGEYRIGISTNISNPNPNDDNLYTTYVKWNNSDTDTIDCEIEDNSYGVIVTKVIFNGEIVWQSSFGTERLIELIK